MPFIEIDTNAPAEKITEELVQDVTKLLSEMLGLDTSWFSVIFRPNPLMRWAGTTEPCAVCRLTAINGLNPENNPTHSKKLFDLIGGRLGVPGNRMYVVFFSPTEDQVGHKGTTIAELKKAASS